MARLIASFREQSNLFDGISVHRPEFTDPEEGAVGSDGSYTPTDITASKQTLTVDQWRVASVYINKKDAKQISYDYVKRMSMRSGYVLARRMDQVILGEYTNAEVSFDAGLLSATNMATKCIAGKVALQDNQCEEDAPWFWVVDPTIDGLIEEKLIDAGFNEADKALLRGTKIKAREFLGFKVLKSNGALTWIGEVLIATLATATDTVVVNGVTWTYVATIGTTAGNVLRGADDDASRANLAAAINAGAGAGTLYVEPTAANRKKLKFVSAVSSDSTNLLTITSVRGRLTMAHTLAASGDGIQNMVLHTLMGKMGAIDLVIQLDIETTEQPVSRKIGRDIITDLLYGFKTFNDGARCLEDFQVTTQADDLTA